MEIWRTKDGSEIAVKAATWELNPKISFESLHDDFQRNPVLAWRNFGSEVKHNLESALKDPNAVISAINRSRSLPWDEARKGVFGWFRGRAGVRYFIHFDLSKNRDATGVAMVHREANGTVVVDFMLRVEAEPGKNIHFAWLREHFIYDFTRRGFTIQCVTYDGFQSEETRQVLEEKGYATDYVSADRNTDAYDTLIDLLLNKRLDFYTYPIFVREMEELKLVNGIRYDHPKKTRTGLPGSKDVADAVACASWKAINHSLENPLPAPGAIRVHRNKGFNDPRRYERSAW